MAYFKPYYNKNGYYVCSTELPPETERAIERAKNWKNRHTVWYFHPETNEICKYTFKGKNRMFITSIDDNGKCILSMSCRFEGVKEVLYYATKKYLLTAYKNSYEGMNI